MLTTIGDFILLSVVVAQGILPHETRVFVLLSPIRYRCALFLNMIHKGHIIMKRFDASKNCAYEAPEGDSNQDHSALCDAGDPD
ncbi:hypothetical protein B0J11DRAFT_89337 [Dendryphion nanum]|uniref:Uncharacterized protein n=1 Tax=Dendryphion nanum TaxID=256645 RepID=A0A9P9DEE6_9PLEO|nr:hypothetical protein B0J11DRAFT_89337 [Dendryphion nanum]